MLNEILICLAKHNRHVTIRPQGDGFAACQRHPFSPEKRFDVLKIEANYKMFSVQIVRTGNFYSHATDTSTLQSFVTGPT